MSAFNKKHKKIKGHHDDRLRIELWGQLRDQLWGQLEIRLWIKLSSRIASQLWDKL